MATLLHIAASPRAEASHSRRATQEPISERQGHESALTVVLCYLAAEPVPHPTACLADTSLTAPPKRNDAQRAVLAPSETLTNELDAADVVLAFTPTHNFTASLLKSRINHVVRRHRTYRSTVNGEIGLLRGRPVRVLIACGRALGSAPPPREDLATPYLRYVLETIRLKDVPVIALENCNRRAPGGKPRDRHEH